MGLKALLSQNEISQSELADGIGRSPALISRLVNGEARPNKDTIDAILGYLSARLGRRVTYEQVFLAAIDEPTPTPTLTEAP